MLIRLALVTPIVDMAPRDTLMLRSPVTLDQLRMMVVLILLSHTVVTLSAAPWYFLPLNISTFMGWIEVATKAVVLETILFTNHRYV